LLFTARADVDYRAAAPTVSAPAVMPLGCSPIVASPLVLDSERALIAATAVIWRAAGPLAVS
jgi:hypothetical protein